jgi:CheY-like chemotaxis protein
MSHSVLLVEPDVDALGELAEGLRARGLEVLLADNLDAALSRLRVTRVSALLIADSLVSDPDLEARLSADPLVARLPRWILVSRSSKGADQSTCLPRHDPETIARRLFTLPSRTPPVSTDRGDFRGDLQQVSVPDLLQLLSMNRRTGALTLVTPTGQGEVRLTDGEIVDAVFRRVEGTKALFRLVAETEGTFSFVSGTPNQLRRIAEPTNHLILEGLRHTDEIRRLLEDLSASQDALQALPSPTTVAPPLTELEAQVFIALEAPRTAAALIDELNAPDLDILNAVERLTQRGLVRRIDKGAVRVELAEAEQLSVLSAIVRQLKRPGFSGNPRIVLFSSPPRLAASLHALSRIADSIALTDTAPAAPVAYRLATLRLAEGQELDLVGLPNNLAFSPLWTLTLPGSAAIVTLGQEHSDHLEDAAGLAAVPLLDAETLIGQIDEGDPRQIAALVRATLEAAAGR